MFTESTLLAERLKGRVKNYELTSKLDCHSIAMSLDLLQQLEASVLCYFFGALQMKFAIPYGCLKTLDRRDWNN